MGFRMNNNKYKVGDTIYCLKEDPKILIIVKGIINDINHDYIKIEEDDDFKRIFYWMRESGELVIKRFGYNIGKFSIVEDQKIGEQLCLKYNLLNALEKISYEVSSILNSFNKKEVKWSLESFKMLDSMIERYQENRNKYLEIIGVVSANKVKEFINE